jgi:K+-transporting ATPase ATPase B chain
MDRALQANIIAKSGNAVETAGDIDAVLLDKTGTITMGNRHATEFVPVGKYNMLDLGRLAAMASIADETPEGKTIVKLYYERGGGAGDITVPKGTEFIAFSAHTRMSGIDLPDGKQIRKGAPDAVLRFVERQSASVPADLAKTVDSIASQGATPLLVAEGSSIAGVVVLSDILKAGISERLERLRKMGVRSVMITGDNPLTAGVQARLHPQGAGRRQARCHDR